MSIQNVGIFYFIFILIWHHTYLTPVFHRNDGQVRCIDRYSDARDGMCGLSSVQRRTCEHKSDGAASGETAWDTGETTGETAVPCESFRAFTGGSARAHVPAAFTGTVRCVSLEVKH